jgi:hypothetical protein
LIQALNIDPGAILDSRNSSLYKTALSRSERLKRAQVAQLVEHCTENAGVGGSIPPLGTTLKFFERYLRTVSSCRAWLTACSTRDTAKLMDNEILFASHVAGLAPCLWRDAFTVLTGSKIHE